MRRPNMLYVTGLLTLIALFHAEGAHIKGGDHIKGGSDTVVSQEQIVPSPYSFNIKTDAAYGTKIVREETGDSEGRVKGSYIVSNPRGTQRVVEYTADDSGFHANIKTSEPNIKTHSPSNAIIEAVTKTGSGGSLQSVKTVIVPSSDAQIRDPAAFPVIAAQIREPIATPVVLQSGINAAPTVGRKTIKTIRRKIVSDGQIKPSISNEPQSSLGVIKTVKSFSDKDVQLAQPESKKVSPAPKPITKGGSVIQEPSFITIDGSVEDAGKEVIVLEDGTIIDASDSSRRLGQAVATGSYDKNQQSKPTNINQDFKMVRGSQVPSSDIRPSIEAQEIVKSGQNLNINNQYAIRNSGPSSGESIVVPGGSGGPSFSLTESEIQNILSSGGVVEFPTEGLLSADIGNVAPPQRRPLVRNVAVRTNSQSTRQPFGVRKPEKAISSSLDRKRTDIRSQTSITASGLHSSTNLNLPIQGGRIVVPGGPRGSSFTLTDSEIQRILLSGGILEFPTEAGQSSFGAKEIALTKVNPAKSGVQEVFRTNDQYLTQTSRIRQPLTEITSPADKNRADLKTRTSSALFGEKEPVTRGSIVVPGGPGGASFTFTETEIQNILSSGGIVEFPSGTGISSTGIQNVGQKPAQRPIAEGISAIRNNVQPIAQTFRTRKPISGISPLLNQKKPDLKSRTTTVVSKIQNEQISRTPVSINSIVVPGGPGGDSFTLTDAEIQRILASGGVLEFPTGTVQDSVGARNILVPQLKPSSEITLDKTAIRSNAQSILSKSGKIPLADRKNIDIRTSTLTSGIRGEQISGPSVVVPGGPRGNSFTLTETEIQRILSSGGILEFPIDGGLGPINTKDILLSQKKPTSGTIQRVAGTRSNIQSQVQIPGQRAPTTGISSLEEGNKIFVPGGPRGASFSLTELEIQKILASGGVVEFPSAGGLSTIRKKDSSLTGFGTFKIHYRNESRKVKDEIRIPAKRVLNSADGKQTGFRSQTTSTVARGNSVVIPGGPGGASFTLTESEIQKILSSGGIVEFPSDGGLRADSDKAPLIKPSIGTSGNIATRTNVQTVFQAFGLQKPTGLIPSSEERKIIDMRSRTTVVQPETRRNKISGGSIVVPGGPGGASFTLTETEIQRILSSGGFVEFPTGAGLGQNPTRNVLVTPSGGRPPKPTPVRSSQRILKQTGDGRKPIPTIQSSVDRKNIDFKTQTSVITSNTGDVNSFVVPGGPGGASFTLTETEIQKIMSSGGVLEFPTEAGLNTQSKPLSRNSPGSVTTRTNIQSIIQPSRGRTPAINTIRKPILRTSTIRKQTNSLRPLTNQVRPGQSIVVQGERGAPTLTLTDTEIENILSTGGILEVPSDSDKIVPAGDLMRINAPIVNTVRTRPQNAPGPELRTSNIRSPTNLLRPLTNQVRPGQSVVVQGERGAPTLTLTDTEIEKILSTGGILEIPSGSDQIAPSGDILKINAPRVSTVRTRPQNAPGPVFQLNSRSPQGILNSVRQDASSYSNNPFKAQTLTKGAILTQEKVQPAFVKDTDLSQQKIFQIQEPVTQIDEQVKLEQIQTFESPVIQTSPAGNKDEQIQVKLDSVLEQKPAASDPSFSQKISSSENLSQKYLQEKVPVELSSYVPQPSFMAPFNYRAPQIRGSSSPIVQEQQKLEQILV